jgi:hypothetical protein
MRLQTGLRCKIVKTKEFPAKSSRIRSYETFWPLMATFAWSPRSPNARDQGHPVKRSPRTMFEGRLLESLCTKWGNNLQRACRPGGWRLRAIGIVVSQVPKCEGSGVPAVEFIISHPFRKKRGMDGHGTVFPREDAEWMGAQTGFPQKRRFPTGRRICNSVGGLLF